MPDFAPESVLLVGAVCAAIAGLALRRRLLDLSGTAAAVGVGLVIGLFGHPAWLFVLLLYMVSSFAATKYRFARKLEMGVAEGRRGERSWRNVAANGAVPAAVAAVAGLYPEALPPGISGLVFLTAIAVAAADTMASEIGVLSKNAVLITHPHRHVEAGTNGGVSRLGHGAAAFAGVYVAVTGYILFGLFAPATIHAAPLFAAVPALLGFVGCQVDSLMGATLEMGGRMTKGWVNFLSIAASTALAWGVLLLLPP
ncbi:MAG TPA: DUF92 domain-containing protein [Candidatus Thermoplasmatota archaeon]|nr:DUF92 domain-containing protein [Candidatus Thermoplasmatota archaeon]